MAVYHFLQSENLRMQSAETVDTKSTGHEHEPTEVICSFWVNISCNVHLNLKGYELTVR
jgi:hypothetical protein